MAGHSKFKNIQFRKDRQDSVRSKLFSKLSRDITIAAKHGVPDPAANARLRLAITSAKAESMPKDNIDRAIKKALGGDIDALEEIRYEGFGPGGAGVIVETLTDNRNRAAANIRSLFSKNGGNLGETGSVAFMFDRLGEVRFPLAAGSEEAVLEAAIEAGAQEAEIEGGQHVILTAFGDMGPVVESLEARLGPPASAKIVWLAKTDTPVTGQDAASLVKLIAALEDDDDVQSVWTNADLDDEDLARLAG
jgi:YebC/PmpR family DNA-binding regulatory protein